MSSIITNSIRKSRKWVTPFVLGLTIEQLIVFVKEGGLSHPLSRSLLLITIGVSLLMFLWGSDTREDIKEKVEIIRANQEKMSKTYKELRLCSTI